jgi:lipopolysaccharide heptosyltransferase I
MTDPAQRFLIVRLSSIGDIVHALPAAVALAQTFPQTAIDWVVEKPYAVLLRGNPYLRRVVVLDTLGWRRRLRSTAVWGEIRQGIGDLRRTPYDAALDFQGLWKSAVVAWLSRAQERIGFAERWLREPSAAVLYTQRVSPPGNVHVVEQNLALARRLGARAQRWEFPLPRDPEDDEYVARRLAGLGVGDFVIINPGGGWRTKCWSPEDYAALVRQLPGVLRAQIILTGSPAEEPMIAEILRSAAVPGAHYMATNLTQFIALARRARLFVGGDTGPLHLAAAVGAPIVGIYGPTDPVRNGPFSSADIALWNHQPVNHTRRMANPAYLPGISVESVIAAVEQRLARAHG